MIAVIFEVALIDGRMNDYLDIASKLYAELKEMEGFISIERFQSFSNSNKLLSLSFWENEAAIMKWRNLETHRLAQQKGGESIFCNYRIRTGVIDRDYTLDERSKAPTDSNAYHKK